MRATIRSLLVAGPVAAFGWSIIMLTAAPSRPVQEGVRPAPFQNPETVGRPQLLEYAHSLQYDTTVSDDTILAGYRYRIAPTVGVNRTNQRALASGRIIGRVSVTLASSRRPAAGPVGGYSMGENYLWQDIQRMRWRTIVIPDAPGASLTSYPSLVRHYPGFAMSAARWGRFPDDDDPPPPGWIACMECCICYMPQCWRATFPDHPHL